MRLVPAHRTVGYALLAVVSVLALSVSVLMTSRAADKSANRRSTKVFFADYDGNTNLESWNVNNKLAAQSERWSENSNSTGPSEVPTDPRSMNVTERQDVRQRHTTSVCSSLSVTERRSTKSEWGELYVNDRHRYIYCKVEKAACTTWKRTLLTLTGKMNVRDPTQIDFFRVHSRQTENDLRPLDSYKPHEVQYRLKNYYKFMFVREPLERLVSAYRDKMRTKEEPPYKLLQQRILRHFQHGGGREVSFKAFVKYVLAKASRATPRELDVHWRLQYRICRPCAVQYDFVGHYETLYEDADEVVSRIAPPNSTVRFPRTDPDNRHKRSTYVVQDMFRTVPVEDAERLLGLYRLDYQLFGYRRPGFVPVAK